MQWVGTRYIDLTRRSFFAFSARLADAGAGEHHDARRQRGQDGVIALKRGGLGLVGPVQKL
jgi:hypothetical protein